MNALVSGQMRLIRTAEGDRKIGIVKAFINKDGHLEFSDRIQNNKVRIEFLVDTGFTGAIALPRKYLKDIKHRYSGAETFETASSDIDISIYECTVDVRSKDSGVFDIEASIQIIDNEKDPLIGMEFASLLYAEQLVFDFENDEVRLLK